jgi:predicted ATP-grasp superfamily ATP-dependent carboligase
MNRLFVCEFITGGGMQEQELPASLAHEGDMMLKALLCDLLDANAGEITITRDPRLPELTHHVRSIVPEEDIDIWKLWQQCMTEADTAWLIAPESENTLYKLTMLAHESDCHVMGCLPEAIAIAGSKMQTYTYLCRAEIPCVQTWPSTDTIPDSQTGWVIKPDDGVGGEECLFFLDRQSLYDHIDTLNNDQSYVVQPFIAGMSVSLSLLCHEGDAELLGCNQQSFDFNNGKGSLKGLIVNALSEQRSQFEDVSRHIVEAIPGLWGYIGVDLIVTDMGPLVLEINPRLTTSYVGLRESLQHNPVEWLLEIERTGRLPTLHAVNCIPITIMLAP